MLRSISLSLEVEVLDTLNIRKTDTDAIFDVIKRVYETILLML